MIGEADSTRIPRWAWAALVVLPFAYLVWNSLYYWPYQVDDAFISLRYARNLVEGHGLVFNPGEHVEGYSNFLWVIVAAALMVVGIPPLAGLKTLGIAAGIGVAWCTWRLGRRLFAGRPLGALAAWLALVLISTHAGPAVWSQGGLETNLFAFLLVGSVLRFEVESTDDARRPLSAVLFALAWMTRPEAPAYALYFAVRRMTARPKRSFRADLRWLATLAVFVLPYEIWGLVYFGHLLPATHAAKVGDGGFRFVRAVLDGRGHNTVVGEFFLEHGIGFGVLLGVGLVGSLVRLRRLPPAIWAGTVAAFAFGAYAFTDWMPWFRLMIPALPFVSLWIAFGWSELLGPLLRRRGPAAVGLGVLVVAFGVHLYRQGFGGWPNSIESFVYAPRGAWWTQVPENLARSVYTQEGETWFLIENVPEHETIVLAAIGLPGYLMGNPIWDVRGLVTPEAAAARHDSGGGAQRAMLDSLWAARPGAMLLPYDRRGPKSIIARFDRLVREDARFEGLYERREDLVPMRIVYRRRDLPEFRRYERIAGALERFPEYRSETAERARAWLRDHAVGD